MSVDMGDPILTVHRPGDIVTVACAGCGGLIRLTWTTSAVGYGIWHESCFDAKEAAA